jgi:PAS domain S-box-containing protein
MTASDGAPGPQTTILVVDDSPNDLEILTAVLHLEGYRVVPARDAQEALSLIERTCPDLVISDIALPEIDGFELCRRLRAWERTSWLPIILVTAVHTEAVDRIRGLETGADDFLPKPVDPQVLRARIHSLLRLKGAREELQQERNRLRGLNYAAARLVTIGDLRELFSFGIEAAIGVADCQQAALFLLEETGKNLRLVAMRGLSARYQTAFHSLVVGESPWTVAIMEGTHLISDLQAGPQPQVYQEVATQEGFRGFAEVPLRGAERVWGMLALYYAQPHPFSGSEVEVIVALANQISLVLERIRRFNLEQRRRQVAEALQRVAQSINATLDPAEVLPLILEQLRAVVPFRSAYLLLQQGDGLHIAACQGEVVEADVRGEVLSLQDYPLLQETLVAGRPLVVPRSARDKPAHGLPGEKEPGSWLSVPMVARGETIGILVVTSSQENTYEGETLEVIQSFGRQAAIAVENAHLFQQVREERRKLEAILNQTTDAVLAIDTNRQILLANPAARQLLGLPDRPLSPLTKALQNEALTALLEQAMQGLAVRAEIPGQEEKRFYASASPVEGVGYVAVIQDITPLKELEQMRLQSERAERDHLRRTLEAYVGPDVVDRVLADGGGLLDRRSRVEVVVLFADIRGFTAASAALPPEATVEVLNEFFGAMATVIYRHQGTLIDLIGDELMASFGAPLPLPNAALQSLEAATALQIEFVRLGQRWQERWGISLGLGIGIDRGLAVMGNIGTSERVSFTLIGNVVNRAHRLVEQAGSGEILLSGEALETIPERQAFHSILTELAETRPGGPQRAYSLRIPVSSGSRPASRSWQGGDSHTKRLEESTPESGPSL